MSVERAPLDTQPVIEVISEDVILPVAESSVYSRTKEKYDSMDAHQKRDFWLAVGATMGGVALTAAAFVVEKQKPASKLPTLLRGAGYALDYADGYFAKRSATAASDGATTEFGAIADPLADKINNTLNEVSLVQKGRISQVDLAIRATRDIGITAARRFVTGRTGGKVDVKANKFGKWNTAVRDSVNLFASTRVAENHPRLNRTLHATANIYSVTSALYTASQLRKAYRKETALGTS